MGCDQPNESQRADHQRRRRAERCRREQDGKSATGDIDFERPRRRIADAAGGDLQPARCAGFDDDQHDQTER
jgi:hypothetical protein